MSESVERVPTRPERRREAPPVSFDDLPPVLRVNSVARLMRVNRKTVYEMVKAKTIPGVVRMGKALRFSRDALLAWLGVRRPTDG